MLDEAELKDFWSLFKDKPVFAKWPDAEAQVSPQIEKLNFKPDQAVFRPGGRAESVYFVGQGTILQIVREDGTPWLRREFKRGDYFGYQALFTDKFAAEIVAATDAVVYTIPAQTLQLAIERDPDLYEELLNEKRVARLRAIPLFRSFPEEDLLRIGAMTEEMYLDAGTDLSLNEKRGLWIIDYGHVRVTGPASLGRSGFRLTAGNFFLTEGTRRGAACVATAATATLATHLFYLPLEHATRLIQAFPDVGQLTAQPVDIVDELAKVPLFNTAGMTDAHRQHLAQFVGWSFVPERQNVTSQGAAGQSYVILRDGAAVVNTLDEQGRLRPRTYLNRGQHYGATSLLEGKTRDVTVRAVVAPAHGNVTGLRGADVLTLDRRDLEYAFAERRDLWKRDIGMYGNYQQTKTEKKRFAWQTEGETNVWSGRSHVWWLIQPLLALAAFAALMWLLAQAAPTALRPAAQIIWLILLGVLGVAALFVVINYYDDYYIVTNRRVIRRDRQLWLLNETLMEAPLETVQDVTLDTNFWGRFLGFGNLTIRTAAKVGSIIFQNLPEAERVRQATLEEKAQVLAITRGYQREALRNELITTLKIVLPVPGHKPALGEDVHPLGWFDRRIGRQLTKKPKTRDSPIAPKHLGALLATSDGASTGKLASCAICRARASARKGGRRVLAQTLDRADPERVVSLPGSAWADNRFPSIGQCSKHVEPAKRRPYASLVIPRPGVGRLALVGDPGLSQRYLHSDR